MPEPLLDALGFAGTWDGLVADLRPAAMRGIFRHPDFRPLRAYVDPSGAIAANFGVDGRQRMSLSVFVPGPPPARLTTDVVQLAPGLAHIDVLDDAGRPETSLTAMVDDPHMYPVAPPGQIRPPVRLGGLRLGAIAVDVDVFESIGDWADARAETCPEPWAGPRYWSGRGQPGPRVTADRVTGMTPGSGVIPAAAPATVEFRAVCRSVHTPVNELTGRSWYRVVAESALPLVLAVPWHCTPAPRPGGVVDGRAVLTATTGFWTID